MVLSRWQALVERTMVFYEKTLPNVQFLFQIAIRGWNGVIFMWTDVRCTFLSGKFGWWKWAQTLLFILHWRQSARNFWNFAFCPIKFQREVKAQNGQHHKKERQKLCLWSKNDAVWAENEWVVAVWVIWRFWKNWTFFRAEEKAKLRLVCAFWAKSEQRMNCRLEQRE